MAKTRKVKKTPKKKPSTARAAKAPRNSDPHDQTLRENLLSDADKFTRFVNSMVRLAEGGIKCEVHKFRAIDRAADAAKQKSPAAKPGISDEALRIAEQKLKLL